MSDRNLRSGLIRLAYENPNLRPHLLPLIEKEAAGKAKVPSMGEVNSAVESVLKAIRSKYRGTLRLADPKKYTDEATKKAEEALLDAFSGTDATQDDLDKAWKQALKKIEAELDDEVSGLEEEAGEDESVASMLEEWQDFLGDFRKAVAAGKHKAPKMKTASLRAATGVPDYADLTKRLLFMLNRMTSPPHAKMVEGVMQVLQAWATANGLDVRHNLKEIAEDLLYDATALGKPSVNVYKVEKVMQGQYPTAFTSRVAAAGIPVTLKKKISLKDGTVIEAGTRGTLRFNEQSPRQAIVDFDTRPNTKLGVANLFDYFGRPFMKVPSMSSLSRMADGLSKSVTGKTVEPDGYGPDGSPSWLLILGMI